MWADEENDVVVLLLSYSATANRVDRVFYERHVTSGSIHGGLFVVRRRCFFTSPITHTKLLLLPLDVYSRRGAVGLLQD